MNHKNLFWIAYYVACATILVAGLFELQEALS